MTSRKPDLAPVPAFFVEPDYLPAELRDELLRHLIGSPLVDAEKAALLRAANYWAQIPAVDTPAAQQAAQLEAVASNARRLLGSLKLLTDDARDVLAMHARCDLGHDRDFLSNAWDMVTALEQASDYTQRQMTVTRQAKPAQLRAYNLVFQLAGHVGRLTGKMPPKDPASWFASFVVRVGEHVGLKVGVDILRKGIDAATPSV